MSSRDSATGYRMPRRAVLGAVAVALLGGCGWQPLYAVRPDGSAGAAQQGLAEVAVGIIPERPGQLLRQALQTRFERRGVGVAKRYDLTVSFGIAGEALNIQQSNSIPSRLRLVGLANWTLVTQDTKRRTLTSGTARVVDGLNFYDQQFFAADLQSEAVQRRLAEAVAEQMTLQLASWFSRQAAAE